MKTLYQTKDGEMFDSKVAAERHEETLKASVNKEKDIANVKEALNKAMFLISVPSLKEHQKSDDLRYAIEKYLRSATVSDEYYSSSDNC